MNPSFKGGALSAPDVDFVELQRQILDSPRLFKSDRKSIQKAQGVYIWWLVDPRTTCLKVGRAFLGARKEGLRRRIRHHFSSNEDNSVLAHHLAADKTSPWCEGAGLENRAKRRTFLETRCCYQVLALPSLTEQKIDEFEAFLEDKMRPRYIGKVGA